MDVLNNALAYISEFLKLLNRVSRLRSATVNAHKTHTQIIAVIIIIIA